MRKEWFEWRKSFTRPAAGVFCFSLLMSDLKKGRKAPMSVVQLAKSASHGLPYRAEVCARKETASRFTECANAKLKEGSPICDLNPSGVQ